MLISILFSGNVVGSDMYPHVTQIISLLLVIPNVYRLRGIDSKFVMKFTVIMNSIPDHKHKNKLQ